MIKYSLFPFLFLFLVYLRHLQIFRTLFANSPPPPPNGPMPKSLRVTLIIKSKILKLDTTLSTNRGINVWFHASNGFIFMLSCLLKLPIFVIQNSIGAIRCSRTFHLYHMDSSIELLYRANLCIINLKWHILYLDSNIPLSLDCALQRLSLW